MPDDRDKLIRECFEHERDLHYQRFRLYHWNEPEIVARCPNPAEREAHLRGFWNHDAEKRFPEYREASKDISMSALLDLRGDLVEHLDALGCLEWRQALAERARVPVNDNEKGVDR